MPQAPDATCNRGCNEQSCDRHMLCGAVEFASDQGSHHSAGGGMPQRRARQAGGRGGRRVAGEIAVLERLGGGDAAGGVEGHHTRQQVQHVLAHLPPPPPEASPLWRSAPATLVGGVAMLVALPAVPNEADIDMMKTLEASGRVDDHSCNGRGYSRVLWGVPLLCPSRGAHTRAARETGQSRRSCLGEDPVQGHRGCGGELEELGEVGGSRPGLRGGGAKHPEYLAQLIDVRLRREPRAPQEQLCPPPPYATPLTPRAGADEGFSIP